MNDLREESAQLALRIRELTSRLGQMLQGLEPKEPLMRHSQHECGLICYPRELHDAIRAEVAKFEGESGTKLDDDQIVIAFNVAATNLGLQIHDRKW